MSEQIYAGTVQYTLIYIFEIPDEGHQGYLKIGQHNFDSDSGYSQLPPNCEELNRNARNRIDQYTRTAMIPYNLLHTELALKMVRLADGSVASTAFTDHDVHDVLNRSGYHVRHFYDSDRDSEWYQVSLQVAKTAIKAYKAGRNVLTAAEMNAEATSTPVLKENPAQPEPASEPKIILRDEQLACIAKTKTVFSSGDRMLWDCKMRFGKTVTAYSLVKEMDYQKVLVVTHRPAVVDGWSKDFKLIFSDNRVFVTKANIKEEDRFTAEDASIDAENDRKLKNLVQSGTPFVYFASMQDLRGSKLAGGKFDKNVGVFAMDWDIIIYDEAHEGTQTELGQSVQRLLEAPKEGKSPKKVLQLSGTPYNLLNQYEDDNVYSWDYVMEQRAKRNWDEKHPGDHNPYADLPEMRICTFDLRKKLDTSYRYEDENIAFNFREFFRTWTGDPERDYTVMPSDASIGDFVHAEDVRAFLDLISDDSESSNYPFANQTYRDMFKHTFWILPGVKEARAFSAMLSEHPVFSKYRIVNVAGEGDVEQPYDDALKAVHEAIEHSPKTITLSCGKLTTGVTVKEWTGVMLLSGSSSTGAAGYMQTIFRAQSAGSIDGKQKKVCYAFDFAPDRTLKVISEVHQLKKSAVGTDDTGRIQLGEFLNFCPVLAEGDTGMEYFDVPKMMRQIKKLTVDAAVKSGFDDDSIYKADAGIVMDNEKLKLVDLLKARLTPQKKGKKETSVKVNEQGLTDEEYKKAQDAKRKSKKDRTPEEKAALEKEKEMRKKQQGLFDLLRNISIRLPLLIYGSATEFDESIRLTEFVNIVDDASWAEFMPKEVDKELFLKLLVFYDEDVIEGAGMRIRRMAKAADEMMPTQRVMKIAEIFSYFRNPAKETVLTPWRVVNMHMGDTIGGYNFYKPDFPSHDGTLDKPRLVECDDVTSDLFLNEKVRVLEMNSKSGLYPLYVAYSIYRMLLPRDESQLTLDEAQAIWYEALKTHLFVLCQTTMAVSITKRTLIGYSQQPVNAVYLTKLQERMQDMKRLANKLSNPATWGLEGERMKFDAIVGNPPYQEMTGGAGVQAKPIYPMFVDSAKELNAQYISMIMPSRWFAGGSWGLDDFRNRMTSDHHLIKVVDYTNAKDLFPNISIGGGICYFLWNREHNGDCSFINIFNGKTSTAIRSTSEFSILVRYNEAVSILRKIKQHNEVLLDTITSPLMPFGLSTNIRGDEEKKHPDDLILYSSDKNPTYYRRSNVSKGNEYIDSYKVIMSKTSAEHAGEPGRDGSFKVFTSSSRVIGPGEICTHSYFLIGNYNDKAEATNLLSYLYTKFVRFLVLLALNSINLSKQSMVFVPLQDFSRSWTDNDLYAKYELNTNEIRFIESIIRPMDETLTSDDNKGSSDS